MKNIVKYVIIFISILLLPACASIVSKSNWPLTVNTYPSGAKIDITDCKGKVVYSGISPVCTNLSASAGYFEKQSYTIKISLDGYHEKILPLECKLNGWYIGNILFGWAGGFVGFLVVDPVTGAMFKLDREYIAESLVKIDSNETTLKVVALQDVPESWKEHLVMIY